VLDLARLLPGPLAARMLAEPGFRVPRQGNYMEKIAPEAYA